MPGKATKVIITERQQQILDEFSRSRSEPSFLRQRSTLILLAFAGWRNEQIALQVDLERHQIGMWRARWAEAFDRLVLVECLQEPPALRQAIRKLLADAGRLGCPGKFSAEQ
jgi:putative transposase